MFADIVIMNLSIKAETKKKEKLTRDAHQKHVDALGSVLGQDC